jgi:hypothetical protein
LNHEFQTTLITDEVEKNGIFHCVSDDDITNTKTGTMKAEATDRKAKWTVNIYQE